MDDATTPEGTLSGSAVSGVPRSAGSFAELLDRVVWDYSPRDDEPTPLMSTARYFDDFPWDGRPTADAVADTSDASDTSDAADAADAADAEP